MNLIEVNNLNLAFKVYGGTRKVLHNVSLSIAPGERVALIGESGSGKSVTSKFLIGTLNSEHIVVESGELLVEGNDALAMQASEREALKGSVMSMIQQDPQTSFNPVFRIGNHLSDIMRAGEKRLGQKKTQQERKQHIFKVLRKVKLLEPERVYNAYPWQLSGGMRQRVLIAMALLHPTRLLIADEPGTALDVTTQDEIIKLINQLVREEQLALLMITHNLGVVRKTADRVYVMQHGRIVEQGNVSDIFSNPAHPYTLRLFNAVPKLFQESVNTDNLPEQPTLVRLVEVEKRFITKKNWRGKVQSEVVAVKPLSLDIRKGDTYGIAGESGSGKTTIARMIMGLIDATSGRIMIEEQPLEIWRNDKQNCHSIQIVHQNPAASLNPRRTVAQTLEVPLKYIARTVDREREINRLLQLVELPAEYAQMYPSSLSGGQKQRVAIARALAANPKILVLDEPTSALDVSVQKNVIELLEKLQAELGLTYIFISHDLSLMRNFCNRVAIMFRGEFIEAGTADDIFKQPTHLYTKALIRAIPVISDEEEQHKPAISDEDALSVLQQV
ncbi:dipeptide ABC transporter ATP-binding protein [Vibrio sp. WJH972]